MQRSIAIVFTLLAILAPEVSLADAPAASPATLDAFSKAWGAVNGYHTQIHCYSVKATQQQSSSYDYTFTKPSSISMNIISGPGAGNNVTWSGGTTVNAGRGMFRKNFNLTDPTVTSLRGATVVDLSFGAILQHAQQTQGTLSGAATTLGAVPVELVNLDVANPTTDNGLTREALYLSTATSLPVRADGYTGAQLVSSCTFTGTTTT